MPKIEAETASGTQTFEAPQGKKLVLAIEDAGFTPNTMVEDIQQDFKGFGVVPATDKTCTGATIPMAEALALSRNCATAYIMQQLGTQGNDGAKRFIEFLRSCNITSKIDPYPSIALGAAEISLYEMMQAYSMFPGRGFTVRPMYLTRIEDKNGNMLQTFVPQRKEVISDVTAYSVINMMQGVLQYGTGKSIWNYGVDGDVAGKTGTTNDNSDAWFMGYTPQLICGVWAGCDDRFIRFASTAVGQGASAALPVWAYFYTKASADKALALDKSTPFAKPDIMQNDISYDWINNMPRDLGAEGGDVGNGNSTDYGDEEMPNIKPEDIAPESQMPSKDTPNKNTPLPPPQPKAVMPKKSHR